MSVVNQEEMAKALRISVPTLRALIRRYADFPIRQRGGRGVAWQLDPAEVMAFVRAKRAEEAAVSAAKDELLAQISLPLEEAVPPEERALSAGDRLKNAQAMLKEDEVARQRGFLVMKTDMRVTLTEAWAQLGQGLQSIPAIVGRRHNLPDAVVRDIRSLIAAQQRAIHARLAEFLQPGTPATAEEDEASDGPSARA